MPPESELKREWLRKMEVLLSTAGMNRELGGVAPRSASGWGKMRGGTWSKLVEKVEHIESLLESGQMDATEATGALSTIRGARQDLLKWRGKHEKAALKDKAKDKVTDDTRKYDDALELDPVLEDLEERFDSVLPALREREAVANGLRPISQALEGPRKNTHWLTPPLKVEDARAYAKTLKTLERRHSSLSRLVQSAPLAHEIRVLRRACVAMAPRILLFNEALIYTKVVSAWPLPSVWAKELSDDAPDLEAIPDTWDADGEIEAALLDIRARAEQLPALDPPETGLATMVNKALDKIDQARVQMGMLEAGDDPDKNLEIALVGIVTEVKGAQHDTVFRSSTTRTRAIRRVIETQDTSAAERGSIQVEDGLGGTEPKAVGIDVLIDRVKGLDGGFAMAPKSKDGTEVPKPKDGPAGDLLAELIAEGAEALLLALDQLPKGIRALIKKAVEVNDDDEVRKGVVTDVVALQWIVPRFTLPIFQPAFAAYKKALMQDKKDKRKADDPSPELVAAKDTMDSVESLQAVLQCVASGTLSKRGPRMSPNAEAAAKTGIRRWAMAVQNLIDDLEEELEAEAEIDDDSGDQDVFDDMVDEGLLPKPKPVIGGHRKR